MTRTSAATLHENISSFVDEIVEKTIESDDDDEEIARPILRHSLSKLNGLDTFHRNAFVNRFSDDYGQPPDKEGIIRYGNKIALKHLRTGRYLHSKETDDMASEVHVKNASKNKLKQYKVVSNNWTPHPQHDYWLVLPCLGQSQLLGKPVPYNKEIRLKHFETNCQLRVVAADDAEVDKNAPLDVTTFPESLSDSNDVWMIQYFVFSKNWDEAKTHKISERADGKLWKVDDMISLRHKATKMVLSSQIDQKNTEKLPLAPVQCEIAAGVGSIWRVAVPVEEVIFDSVLPIST